MPVRQWALNLRCFPAWLSSRSMAVAASVLQQNRHPQENKLDKRLDVFLTAVSYQQKWLRDLASLSTGHATVVAVHRAAENILMKPFA